VLSVAELIDDQQYVARGAFVTAEHPTEGGFRLAAPAFAGQRGPSDGVPVAVPDWRETHTAELLATTGMAEPEIAHLIEEGAVA
jgi:crotonobetainyl-CoA:carnitine CoA-transferase CaiB-like acyl-CoA transferase